METDDDDSSYYTASSSEKPESELAEEEPKEVHFITEEKRKLYESVKVCKSVDMYVSGLGLYNTCTARNALKELNNPTLWALKYGWQQWQRLSIHSTKFMGVFITCKLAAAATCGFMKEYFDKPRRLHALKDDEFNWSVIPSLVDYIIENKEKMKKVAEGQMTVHNFRICKAIIKEAKWEVLTKEDMDHLRKQNVALFWLLTWARGATFRKFAIERGKVIQDERLKRFASKVSVTFVSKIMREHTPLYHVSDKSWLTVVDAKEDSSSEEEWTTEDDDDSSSSDDD